MDGRQGEATQCHCTQKSRTEIPFPSLSSSLMLQNYSFFFFLLVCFAAGAPLSSLALIFPNYRTHSVVLSCLLCPWPPGWVLLHLQVQVQCSLLGSRQPLAESPSPHSPAQQAFSHFPLCAGCSSCLERLPFYCACPNLAGTSVTPPSARNVFPSTLRLSKSSCDFHEASPTLRWSLFGTSGVTFSSAILHLLILIYLY